MQIKLNVVVVIVVEKKIIRMLPASDMLFRLIVATRLSLKCHVDRRTHLARVNLRPTRLYELKIKTASQNAGNE